MDTRGGKSEVTLSDGNEHFSGMAITRLDQEKLNALKSQIADLDHNVLDIGKSKNRIGPSEQLQILKKFSGALHESGGHAVVAEENGKIAGFIAIEKDGEGVPWVRHMWVSPGEGRQKHVIKELIKRAWSDLQPGMAPGMKLHMDFDNPSNDLLEVCKEKEFKNRLEIHKPEEEEKQPSLEKKKKAANDNGDSLFKEPANDSELPSSKMDEAA